MRQKARRKRGEKVKDRMLRKIPFTNFKYRFCPEILTCETLRPIAGQPSETLCLVSSITLAWINSAIQHVQTPKFRISKIAIQVAQACSIHQVNVVHICICACSYVRNAYALKVFASGPTPPSVEKAWLQILSGVLCQRHHLKNPIAKAVSSCNRKKILKSSTIGKLKKNIPQKIWNTPPFQKSNVPCNLMRPQVQANKTSTWDSILGSFGGSWCSKKDFFTKNAWLIFFQSKRDTGKQELYLRENIERSKKRNGRFLCGW